MANPMRVLELFSGVGSVSAAIGRDVSIVGAVDINRLAVNVYQANFDTPTWVREITSLSDQQFRDFGADLWWMSPPCQPFTRRGLFQDEEDSRSAPLLRILEAIESVRPTNIAIENVIGFEESQMHRRLTDLLERSGYAFTEAQLCSTQFGIPNLRPRYFLAASRSSQPDLKAPVPTEVQPIQAFLESPDLRKRWGDIDVTPEFLDQYAEAISVVQPHEFKTRCFTSAYGHSKVRSGSYLRHGAETRRFSPREVANLLGFPREFSLPDSLSTRQYWKLLGNAVSVPCVKYVVQSFG